jgi:hypothetical protein
MDVDAVTRGILAMLDGLLLQRIEAGDAYRPGDLHRRAGAMAELLLAAAGAERPPLDRAQTRTDSISTEAPESAGVLSTG